MNRFTAVSCDIPDRYDRAAINQMIRWCKDHISLKGDKWDLEIKWVSPNDGYNRVHMKESFIFENKEHKTLFALSHLYNDVIS